MRNLTRPTILRLKTKVIITMTVHPRKTLFKEKKSMYAFFPPNNQKVHANDISLMSDITETRVSEIQKQMIRVFLPPFEC